MIISLLDYKKKKNLREDIGFFSKVYQANCSIIFNDLSNYFDGKIRDEEILIDVVEAAYLSLYNYLDSIYHYEEDFDIIFFEIDDDNMVKNYDREIDTLRLDFTLKYYGSLELNADEKLKLYRDGKVWMLKNRAQDFNLFLSDVYKVEDSYYEKMMLAFKDFEDFNINVKNFEFHSLASTKIGFESDDLFNEDAFYLKGDIKEGSWVDLKNDMSIRLYLNGNRKKVYIEIQVMYMDERYHYKIPYSSWEKLVYRYIEEDEISFYEDDYFAYSMFGEVIFGGVNNKDDLENFFTGEGILFSREKKKDEEYFYVD